MHDVRQCGHEASSMRRAAIELIVRSLHSPLLFFSLNYTIYYPLLPITSHSNSFSSSLTLWLLRVILRTRDMDLEAQLQLAAPQPSGASSHSLSIQ